MTTLTIGSCLCTALILMQIISCSKGADCQFDTSAKTTGYNVTLCIQMTANTGHLSLLWEFTTDVRHIIESKFPVSTSDLYLRVDARVVKAGSNNNHTLVVSVGEQQSNVSKVFSVPPKTPFSWVVKRGRTIVKVRVLNESDCACEDNAPPPPPGQDIQIKTPTENAVDGDKNTDGGDVTPAWSYGSLFLWGVIALVVVTVVVAIIVRKRLSKNKKQAKGGDGSTAPPSNLNRHESINSLYYNPPQPISRHESINSLYYNPPQPISRHESINSLYYNPPQPISRHESINSLYYNPQQRDHEGDCSPSGPGAAEGASSHTYATLDEYELGYVMPNVTANEDM